MKKLKKSGLPVDVYSPEERALVLERELVNLLDSGAFRFEKYSGYLTQHAPGTTACGCVVGGLAYAFGALRGNSQKAPKAPVRELLKTGLLEEQELLELEQGYEFGANPNLVTVYHPTLQLKLHQGPFFEAGCRLRARLDADPSWGPK